MRDVWVEPVQIVKSAALAPGRNSGHRCENSSRLRSGVVTAEQSPPDAETRKRPEASVGAKRIVSSSPQLAPQLFGAWHSEMAEPFFSCSFFNRPSAKKPTQSPPGEK